MALWTRHFHNSIKYFRAKTVGSRAAAFGFEAKIFLPRLGRGTYSRRVPKGFRLGNIYD